MKSNTVNNLITDAEKNTIKLIEQLATQSTLQELQPKSHAIKSTDITCELKKALLEQDISSLEAQLNLSGNIKCVGIFPAEDEEEQTDEQEGDQEDNKEAQSLIKFAI
ncbi:hypothetical protein KO495_10795 [Colwellia sp. D2M02]|uniref:Uncharacterized protein n=1 Tax=Colwellia asteriadis TaxID=517723 RepID=A0ABN1L9J4_9GAMM|nr:hypothetical protein [Colwellia sp. D2M02]MBU2893809.1 hypothetical protein [Colwellia sp. D2M02]